MENLEKRIRPVLDNDTLEVTIPIEMPKDEVTVYTKAIEHFTKGETYKTTKNMRTKIFLQHRYGLFVLGRYKRKQKYPGKTTYNPENFMREYFGKEK